VAGSSGGIPVDEEPLRAWVLKAYHEKRQGPAGGRRLLDAIRRFLSGPPGGPSVPDRYYFEDSPAASLQRFAAAMEEAAPGLSQAVFAPLLAAAGRKGKGIAPNLSVFIASLAGPIALKSGVDETIVCALLAAALLGVARLGTEAVSKSLSREP
jgi:hypothetical protein